MSSEMSDSDAAHLACLAAAAGGDERQGRCVELGELIGRDEVDCNDIGLVALCVRVAPLLEKGDGRE